ncbi:hypothetical protein [Geosporobacter ferrireducens]|uniref:DUF4829 domain-containing protein n=1 Tax=Geosporobacter ferrireducens TaxID=1424294 RepID=A0A1D8GGL7_9FIRM|nr:hypothetical protein [Geosporobacter ferrireducens]AOT70049.1 hypothetical protein Gferi_10900 [Geosporobacter ferrireducens]MTI53403.1 hypothetical protein [Geosporobacter ferrireducens]
MEGKIRDVRNYEEQIKSTIFSFYEAFYKRDRLMMYSYLDTSFQREVPLNYFLIHPEYDKDLGRLLEIIRIEIQHERKIAFVEGTVEMNKENKNFGIALKTDFGGWKIEGESIYKRDFVF